MSKAPPKVASSVFQSGPDDDLVAKDARGKTSKEQLARGKPKASSPQAKAAERFSKSNFNVADLAKMTSLNGGVKLDSKVALSRVDNILGQNVSGIVGERDALREKAAFNITNLVTDGRYSGVLEQGGQALQMYRDTDSSKATSLLKSLSSWQQLPLVNNYVDQTSWLGSGLALLDTAMALGIPEAIDTIAKKLKNEKLAKRRLIDGLRGAVLRGDLPTVNKVIDLIGVEAAKQRVPNMPVLLLAGFRFPPKTKVEEYPGYRTDLLATITRIDPLWDRTNWQGQSISSLAPFRSISQASRILLTLNGDPTWREQILIGRSYRLRSIIDLGRTSFPQTVSWLR